MFQSFIWLEHSLRGDNQIRTGDQGVADPRLTTWLCRHILYFIICKYKNKNDSKGIWTPDTTVKGWCLNRLTMEPYIYCFIYNKNVWKSSPIFILTAPRVGLEPTTTRLTAECSTIELSRITYLSEGFCSFKTAH